MTDDDWTYRGIRCMIREDWDDSDRWVYHMVEFPDGRVVPAAGISPRAYSRVHMNRWVDEYLGKVSDGRQD